MVKDWWIDRHAAYMARRDARVALRVARQREMVAAKRDLDAALVRLVQLEAQVDLGLDLVIDERKADA